MQYTKKNDGMIVPCDYSEYVRIQEIRTRENITKAQDEKINRLEEMINRLLKRPEENNG